MGYEVEGYVQVEEVRFDRDEKKQCNVEDDDGAILHWKNRCYVPICQPYRDQNQKTKPELGNVDQHSERLVGNPRDQGERANRYGKPENELRCLFLGVDYCAKPFAS